MRARTARPRRTRLIQLVSVLAALGVVTTLAVTAQGYDAQEVPRLDPSVWVTRDSGQYARVNTELSEIDVVRQVDDPSGVAQSGSSSVVFTQGFRQGWPVDGADPVDLVAEGDGQGGAAASGEPPAGDATPSGTRDVVSAGDWVAYRTDTGGVFAGRLDDPSAAAPVDPFAADPDADAYVAAAVAVSADGTVAMYSAAEKAVRRYDAATHEFSGPERVQTPPDADAAVALVIVGARWVLSDAASARAWVQGRTDPVATGVGADGRLQESTTDGDTAYIADSDGLVAVSLSSGTATRVADADGVPAAPAVVGGVTYAAWLSAGSGSLWSSADGDATAIEVDRDALADVQAITPVIRSNGERGVLNETASGLLWTLPDGVAIPLGQWSIEDDVTKADGTAVVDDVAEQKPPVAVADSFGVRAGAQAILPVLLNDHDPNKKDVLSIDPASVTALSDPAFGQIGLIADNQQLVVRVGDVSGSATFSYAVTDGQDVSPPVTVTLTVSDAGQNSAPVWCGVDACQQDWPSPQVLPGGTVVVPVLTGWVDPDGDPFVLSGAVEEDVDAPVTVVPMADGRVAVRHTDANAPDASIPIRVTVTDAAGASAEQTLTLTVTGSPSLDVAPVVAVTAAGESTQVRISDHVMGGSGSYRLLDAVATATGETGLTVVPNAAAGTVDLSAAAPGTHLVTYSVQDTATQAEQSAVIRLVVLAPDAAITVPPLTAFVRPGEDTTIDVLDTVRSSSGRVLLVSGAESSTGDLSVGVVGQARVRVSGSTPDGLPGRIGTARITVADGAGAAADGDLTVFLVSPTTDSSPIAMPDTVTTRAGELVTIPVTRNDVSPRGQRLTVHPDVTVAKAPGELAYSTGDGLRYLAPTEPGVYTVGYSVFLENAPERLDGTTVTVTVLPTGANRAPQPTALSARVLSGQSVSVELPASGIDPDGDRVTLARVEQPPAGAGTATISAEGDAIVYTAPADGIDGGQVSFGYTVRDAAGAEASSTVKVGVLQRAAADAAPVTFSDYMRVQKGTAGAVTVLPLGNDRDPAQGTLELIDLVPNAPAVPGNPEYERLSGLIDPSTSLADGRVRLRAGDVAGPASFIYTVRSSRTSSTAQGLIVLNVTDAPSPDQPVVRDTVLTAKNRADLGAGGVDVVTGRVQWATGDVSGMKLSLWGDAAARYEVSGHRITGKLPGGGDIVPFRLTGEDSAGTAVTAYGILRIPAFDDMRVQVRPDFAPLDVAEEGSVEFQVRDVLDLGSGDTVELRTGDAFPTQRSAARCTPRGSGGAVYSAGREAPWTDSCLIAVRLDGQKQWSWVGVPIAVQPKDPQAILTSVSRTIAPGAVESVDLLGAMTTWEGGRVGDTATLDFAVGQPGSAFIMTRSGTSVSFEARADARPGTRETVPVSVSAFGGLTAGITLVVGAAPADAPRGATFGRQCTVSQGSCTIDVVGIGGEYDPFAGKTGSGLKLAGVAGGAVRCAVATVTQTSPTQVTAVWPSGPTPVGGECVVAFTVADAQGRTGAGQLSLDVLGYPQKPASVTTVGYTGTSVTLQVALGEAAQAHPSITGVGIFSGGRAVSADCSPSGPGAYQCTVGGLVNGERHEYTARAVNSVGQSLDTSPVTTWAYRAPEVSSVTAEPVYRPGRTTENTAVVQLKIASAADSRAFRIIETGATIGRAGDVTTTDVELAPGAQMITVVPISQFEPPIGAAGNEGTTARASVTAAGAPYFSPRGIQASAASNTSVSVSGPVLQANGSTASGQVVYLAWRSGNPQCSADGSGRLSVSGAEAQSTSTRIEGLTQYQEYQVKACASNGFGVTESETTSVFVFSNVDAPTGEASYRVATTPSVNGTHYAYGLDSGPSMSTQPKFRAQYNVYGSWRDSFELSPDSAPGEVRGRACHERFTSYCSTEIAITAATAPTTVTVDFPQQCVEEATEGAVRISQAARGSRQIGIVPAADGLSAVYTITWTGAFAALDPITATVEICPQDPGPGTDPGTEDPPTP